MSDLYLALAAATPTPTTGGVSYPDAAKVTPGTIGFVVTILIVIAAIFLMRDAMRRVRRVRARDDAETEYSIPLRSPHAVPNRSDLPPADERTVGDETEGAAGAEDPEDGNRG
ncbi:hypothetical protein NQ038_02020 [Brevibacterium sp. 50QC2O2]|uniref:hypothetical protein n=1 Tax=unclassified Brevibacterium TaxID=2614124 RepID=UPI00211C591D|nr:hypothetical protein [Brevibacterium sp. 91QC2O2]MCQ9387427.1 hypothetical protein [Brevibacterium sp. 50QC2O2]